MSSLRKDGQISAIEDREEGSEMTEPKNDTANHTIEALVAVEAALATTVDDARARNERLTKARQHLRSALGLAGGIPESVSAASHG